MSSTAVRERPALTIEDADLLRRHLSEEAAAQQEVLRHLAEQERLLVKNDVEGLRSCLSGGDPMLARLQALTGARMRILSLLGKKLGIAADAVSVTLVLGALAPADRDRLDAQADEIRAVVAEVDKRARRVNALLRSASDTNDALLHGLLGGQAPIRTYRPDGRRGPPSGLSHFTREI